jgi:tetrathionate reductase subunit B
MLIDVTKCIGCGNCVRACAAENDVPEGYFRTWVEHYHVDDWHGENPVVESPDGGKHGFRPTGEGGGKDFFVPKMCNPLRGLALRAGMPRRRDLFDS